MRKFNLWELQLPWCELMQLTCTMQAKSCFVIADSELEHLPGILSGHFPLQRPKHTISILFLSHSKVPSVTLIDMSHIKKKKKQKHKTSALERTRGSILHHLREPEWGWRTSTASRYSRRENALSLSEHSWSCSSHTSRIPVRCSHEHRNEKWEQVDLATKIGPSVILKLQSHIKMFDAV